MTITRLRMRIPDLRVQADIEQIKVILSGTPGVDSSIVDHEAGIMDLVTAAQDGGADAIRRLSEGGYPPSEVETLSGDARPS